MKNCTNSELKARVFGIHLAETYFAHTDNLNKTLQSTRMTLVDAKVLVSATVKTDQSIQSEKSFKLFWAKMQRFVTDHWPL